MFKCKPVRNLGCNIMNSINTVFFFEYEDYSYEIINGRYRIYIKPEEYIDFSELSFKEFFRQVAA